MKKLIFFITVFGGLTASAQNYLIDFKGSGGSTIVNTVKVENLSTGDTKTINGSDVLHLTGTTGINTFDYNQSSKLKIYPNPMTDNATLQVYAPVAGDAVVSVLDMTGKPVVQIQSFLENSKQDFRLSGIKNGFYLISIKGNSYKFSGKLLSNGKSNGTIGIEKVNNMIQAVDEKIAKSDIKGTQATIEMAYTNGDRLKFTGISGTFSTVKIDIPVSNKTIEFNFIACTDEDNNNYPVVQIGTQIWMAENLKTSKYSDGTAIPLVTDNTAWASLTTPGYTWYNNNEATYKLIFGALYNWYAVSTGKLCPNGWHISTEVEWTTFESFLIENGYNYDGTNTGNKIAKSMAANSSWLTSPETGSPGNDQKSNNSSGFTALASGYRSYNGGFTSANSISFWWSTTEYDPTYPRVRYMENINIYLTRGSYYKQYGFSIRCLKD
jgi:uncharacterized protein (TIGR02145 family)